MQKFWQIKEQNPQLQIKFTDSLHIHPIISQLLINREITTVEEARNFLFAGLAQVGDPFLFKDMDKAVKRIKKAQANKEKILIFGDYHVDGVTSSALLYKVLTQLGLNVINHIPHRQNDGYGLNENIGEFAKEEGISLLIAVDCGITAVKEVEIFNKLGIEVIILDHHEPGEDRLPDALAIINPKQKGCAYPFKYFSSVGLVAKFTQALLGRIKEEDLDLVAIGTIADVVPLRGENRIFVKEGLPRINSTHNKGLLALLETAKIKDKKISPYFVGFILGPRINATGRMDSAHKSLDLLLSEDHAQALSLAKVLEGHNKERQRMQKDVVEEALAIIEQEVNFKDHKVIVLSKEGWHRGVLGIVASRITEMYYRPTIVISVKDGVGTASARSIDGFHLYNALSECGHILEAYGGHEGAAGLTIKEENIDTFRQVINELAHKTLEIKDLIPSISIDCEIPLASIDMKMAEMMDVMEPFGEGNPIPVFCTRQVTVESPAMILGKDTIKFWISDGKAVLSAVGFGMAKYRALINVGQKIDVAYQVAIDDWNKEPVVQLKLKDIRISE